MVETNIGGDDGVIISPWRHLREKGSIALDMGVHYTDIFAYFLGALERVCGVAFIAEPRRRARAGHGAGGDLEELSPGVMRATGDDSLVALYETASGVKIQLSLPALRPGPTMDPAQVHGRAAR